MHDTVPFAFLSSGNFMLLGKDMPTSVVMEECASISRDWYIVA